MAHGHEVGKFGCLQPLEKMLKLHIEDFPLPDAPGAAGSSGGAFGSGREPESGGSFFMPRQILRL